jgi:hypothetical protein
MQNYEQAVFISYAWEGELEHIVNQIDEALQQRGIKIIRDRRDLVYKSSIKEFMERIGRGNCVIVVVSEQYLRSPHCMFELVEIAEHKQFYDRVFPIVLAETNIYDPLKRIDYIKYWEAKRAELAEAIRTLDPANLQGIHEDMDLYDRIRDKISGLTGILKDMNALTPEIHQNSNFFSLYDAIEKRIKESAAMLTAELDEAIALKAKTTTIGASENAAVGLTALRELMQRSSDVRNAVIEFQTDFRVAHEQVNQLGDYKDLHDLLHRIQFSCYNGIVHAAAHFQSEETIDILTDHILTFENIIDELRLVAARPSMPKQELRWIGEAEQMKLDLRIAITSQDEKKLKNVIARLNRLLATHLARINTLLNHAARALRLPALWNALGRVCNDLTSLNLDPDNVKAFQSGVDALSKIESALSDLVDSHDRWQTLEVELRLIESLVEQDLDQLEMDWPNVKQKAEPLYMLFAYEWANALKQESNALDEALSNKNRVAVRRSFHKYQRRAINRFYQVDLELKALCGNLRQVGVPLAAVLEMTT